jgi:hypothetical protein
MKVASSPTNNPVEYAIHPQVEIRGLLACFRKIGCFRTAVLSNLAVEQKPEISLP